ncbi:MULTISPECIES: putative phage abortive infection protein [unclassified Paenibacillus]|nr:MULTISPECIES: putative phage abortive infection protein [unclassified Paenibacillus]
MSNSNDWIGFLGSYLGGIFGGLFTLLGVLITIRKQDEQNHKMEMIQYDNTFFKLISLHNELSNNISIRIDVEEEIHGRNVFKSLYKEMKSIYNEILDEDYGRFNISIKDNIKFRVTRQAYNEIYSKYETSLIHYIRNLRFIIESIINLEDKYKEKYISILRAQLTQSEIIFIFYYCTTANSNGNENLIMLAEKANLFNNSDRNLLIDSEHYCFFHDYISLDAEIDEITLFLDHEDIRFGEDDE